MKSIWCGFKFCNLSFINLKCEFQSTKLYPFHVGTINQFVVGSNHSTTQILPDFVKSLQIPPLNPLKSIRCDLGMCRSVFCVDSLTCVPLTGPPTPKEVETDASPPGNHLQEHIRRGSVQGISREVKITQNPSHKANFLKFHSLAPGFYLTVIRFPLVDFEILLKSI